MPPLWSPNPRSLLSRAELRARGVHSRRLASAEFTEAVPGFMTPAADPAALHLVARVLQNKALPGAVISHVSAAELVGAPLPSEHEYAQSGIIHCTLPAEARRRTGARVALHARTGPAATRVRGLQLSCPIALLCELAGMLDHGDLVACCDQILGPKSAFRPRPSLRALREQAATISGVHGIKRVRKALADARERVESPKETELRLLLQDEGFLEPVVNYEIRAPGTGEGFRLDLAYPSLRIAIEYDGFWHSTDKERHRADRRKDDVLHELGWRVVRAADRDLSTSSDLLGRLIHLGAPQRRGPGPDDGRSQRAPFAAHSGPVRGLRWTPMKVVRGAQRVVARDG